jgi:hypothetical protein
VIEDFAVQRTVMPEDNKFISKLAPSDGAFIPRNPEQFQKFLELDNVKDAFAHKIGLIFLA